MTNQPKNSGTRKLNVPVFARGDSVSLVWGIRKRSKLVPIEMGRLNATAEMRMAAVEAWCNTRRPKQVPEYDPGWEIKPGDGVYDRMAKETLKGLRRETIAHNQQVVHRYSLVKTTNRDYLLFQVPAEAHAAAYPRWLAGYRTKIVRTADPKTVS